MTRPGPLRLARAAHWLTLIALLAGTLAWAPAAPSAAEDARVDVLTLAFAASTPPAPTRLLAHIYFADAADRDQLAARLDAMETATTGGYVTAIISPAEQAALVAQGYRVEIDAARTALLNAQAPLSPAQTDATIPGYVCYRTVEETYAALAGLAAAHPDLAEWVDIGDSWEKLTAGGAPGYDLNVLVLTNENVPGPKPAFFLMAAIHAREYTTAELATRYAEYLVNNYGVDADVTWLLDNFEIHILPQANPDGRHVAEGGVYQRKNLNPSGETHCSASPTMTNQYGVDLNRNADWHWNTEGADSLHKCAQTYPGLSASSEPETAAILAYLTGLFPDQRGPLLTDAAPADASGVMITLHSFGELVLFAWGDTPSSAPNKIGLQTLGRKFGYFNDYDVCQPSVTGCLYSVSGSTDDWTYGTLGVASYTFEMGTQFFQSCTYFNNTIVPGNLPALLYAAKAARRPYQAPSGPDTLAVSVPVTTVVAGVPLSLTATADDTRYGSGGQATTEPRQNIAAARYSFDTPSWASGTVTYPLAAADGLFNAKTEGLTAVLDTTNLTPGRHLVLVESQDVNGNWGVPSAIFIQVQPPTSFVLAPSPAWAWGDAGQPATHTLWLTNTSPLTNTFGLTVTGGAWPAGVPATVGPVGPGQVVPITVTVNIPGPANPADLDQALLSVTPLSPAGAPLTATLFTVVHTLYGVYLTPPAQALTGTQGSAVTYTVSITNIGELPDTFYLSLTGWVWTTTAVESVGPLAPGQSVSVTVTVNIPTGLAPGASDTASVQVTSQGESNRTATVTLTTTAPVAPLFLPLVQR